MSTVAGFDQRQYMMEEHAWAACVLRCATAEIRRDPVFRALLAELTGKLFTRSDTDAALMVLCPGASWATEEYYAGRRPELRRLLLAPELDALDAWLVTEVRRWSTRWVEVDPARTGSAVSTRAAVEEIRAEMASRPVPATIASIAAKLPDGSFRPA